jgi:hypothetical protein
MRKFLRTGIAAGAAFVAVASASESYLRASETEPKVCNFVGYHPYGDIKGIPENFRQGIAGTFSCDGQEVGDVYDCQPFRLYVFTLFVTEFRGDCKLRQNTRRA